MKIWSKNERCCEKSCNNSLDYRDNRRIDCGHNKCNQRICCCKGSTGATGATITVLDQGIPDSERAFDFYRTKTIAAPMDVTSAIIRFEVIVNGKQSLDIDDVSFEVA